ncbi:MULTISPECIES: hypothetical protein [unclassified Brevundimonas]|uniref:hypothetical protein n=1 Tax=unclassified Brevundimonas TaxID=2622653 RepID=UPI0025BE554C|nr:MULTISPECIES: hypothetical protein [unclassified Brevundimonas]
MALPTSGSISIDQIKAELGITGELSLLDQRVRNLAGIQSGSLTLPNDFWGKSARNVSIAYTYRFMTVGGRFGQGYDQLTFRIVTNDGSVPTSYSWSGAVGGTASTAVFRGPTYQQDGYTSNVQDTAYCTVVIAGQSYVRELSFTYTMGDAI